MSEKNEAVQNGDEQVSEADLAKARAEREQAEKDRILQELETARIARETADLKHAEALKSAVSSAISSLGLQAYNLDNIVKMFALGDSNIEVVRTEDGPKVTVNGDAVSFTSAVMHFRSVHPQWFEDAIQRPQLSEEAQAELAAKSPSYRQHYQEAHRDNRILALSDFQSDQHKARWMMEHPGEFEKLPSTRDSILAGRDPARLTRSQYLLLDNSEKAKVLSKVGLRGLDRIMDRK